MKRNNQKTFCLWPFGIRLFSIIVAAIFASVNAVSAFSVKVGDLYFTTNENNKTAQVTYQSFQNYSNYSGLTSVHIPNSINVNGVVYQVTAIDDYAFYRAQNLSYVSMDVGIKKIGKFAFNECSSLGSIIFPDNLENIGEYAFCRCYSLQSLVLPNGLLSISQRAFQECSKLTKVDFPSSISSIGHSIFYKTDNIRDIYLHNISSWCDVDSESSIFYGVKNVYLDGKIIDKLEIPNGVIRISPGVFSGLKCVSSISFPSTIINIGENAFYNCDFKELHITDLKFWCSVDIEPGNFNNIENLFVGDELISNLVIPSGTKGISRNVFKGIASIQEIQFPESLGYIGDKAFSNCYNIERIRFNKSINSVGNYSFYQCSKLKEILIEDGETSISFGDNSFRDCPIQNIYLGRNASLNGFQNLQTVLNVEIGEYVNDCRAFKWENYVDLRTIKSKALAPPQSQNFLDKQYKDVIVSVPEVSKKAYESDLIWGPF